MVHVNWAACTASQLYAIVTSPHLMCGAFKSMAFVLKHAITQLTSNLMPFLPDQDYQALKRLDSKKPTPALQAAFEKCCHATGIMVKLRAAMTAYTALKTNVVRVRPGVLPAVNTTVQDTLRLASFMVDPRCVDIFGRMANPAQDRLALQFPTLRVVEVKQRLFQEFTTEFFMNPDVTPQSNPDISAWCHVDYCVARPPAADRNWIWVGAGGLLHECCWWLTLHCCRLHKKWLKSSKPCRLFFATSTKAETLPTI